MLSVSGEQNPDWLQNTEVLLWVLFVHMKNAEADIERFLFYIYIYTSFGPCMVKAECIIF